MSAPLEIKPIPNGPLAVSQAESLQFEGEVRALSGTVYLCRCGESRNAPFCDGSHNAAGFSSEGPRPEPVAPRIWEGQRLRTRFDPRVCMHVFTCKPLKALREAEVLATDDAVAIEIRAVAAACPSGALTWEEKAPLPPIEAPVHAAPIEVIPGGELRFHAPVRGLSLDPAQPDDRLTLCRCGLSANKPLCDGRHKAKVGFR